MSDPSSAQPIIVTPKPWYLSRLVWLGIAEIVLEILAYPDFLALVPMSAMPYVRLLAGILTVVLRQRTTQPVQR